MRPLPRAPFAIALAVLERRDNVPNAGQSRPLHQRPFGFIDDLINPAGLGAARAAL